MGKEQFTVTPVSVVAMENQFDVLCVIEGPGTGLKEHFYIHNLAGLKSFARDRVDALSGDPAEFKEISAVLNQPLDLSEPAPAVPTLETLFSKDARTLVSMKRAIDLGVKLNTDKDFTSLQQSIFDSLQTNPDWVRYL